MVTWLFVNDKCAPSYLPTYLQTIDQNTMPQFFVHKIAVPIVLEKLVRDFQTANGYKLTAFMGSFDYLLL